MAVKLSEADLPHLLPWLEQHFPLCFRIYGLLKSHLNGHAPDLEFFVDRWPHPQAVVARENPAGEQMVCSMGHVCVFGVNDKALADLLRDPNAILWTKIVKFAAAPSSLISVLTAVAEEMGQSFSHEPVVYLKATADTLKPIPVPEGLKVQPISNAEIKMILSTWKYSYGKKESYIQNFVEKYPSFCLVTKTGHYVGHMIGTTDGTMGFLYVSPEFRGKGYAKVIISQLSQKYFHRGEDAYVEVVHDNFVSLNLHKSLGFMDISEQTFVWMHCA